jgi:hypothetical protein
MRFVRFKGCLRLWLSQFSLDKRQNLVEFFCNDMNTRRTLQVYANSDKFSRYSSFGLLGRVSKGNARSQSDLQAIAEVCGITRGCRARVSSNPEGNRMHYAGTINL